MRNRIISGLSDVVVVVEAAFSSGALKTAEYADEQGKILFAVPGSIFSSQSIGTNKLIMDGANILSVLDDPFIMIGFGKNSEELLEKKLSVLGGDEQKIYNLIKNEGEMTIEEICEKSLLSPSLIVGIVTVMEMKGYLTTCMGRIFIDKIAY